MKLKNKINLKIKIMPIILVIIIISHATKFNFALGNENDEDILSIDFNRNVGTALGDKIEGKFTIKGTGTNIIVELKLLFNGTQVAHEMGNELVFKFNTNDYNLGKMNITLIGYDNQGNQYQIEKVKAFISPVISIFIIIGAILLVFVSLFFRYKENIKSKIKKIKEKTKGNKGNKGNKEKKDKKGINEINEIKIEIDDTFS